MKKFGHHAKNVGKHALQVSEFVPIPFVPPVALDLIRAAIATTEAKGGKGKLETALAQIIPALNAAGVPLPVKRINLAIDLLLDEDINSGSFEFNVGEAAEIVKGASTAKLDELAKLIAEARKAKGQK